MAASLALLSMGASTTQIGLILALYTALPMVLSIGAGRLIDRAGPRWPMVVGALGTALGVVLPFFVFNWIGIALASVLVGVSFMLFNLCLHCVGGELSQADQLQRNFSVIALGFSISAALGPLAAGLLIDTLGHRATFAVLAAPPLLAFFVLFALPMRSGAHLLPSADNGTRNALGRGAWQLLRIAELRRLYLAVAVVSSAWDVHQFLVPLYGAGLGFSASSIGLILAAFAAAGFTVRALLSWAGRRVNEWQVIYAAIGVGAAVLLAYPFFPALPVMLAMSFVFGLGIGAAQPMLLSILYRSAPADRVGEAAGLRLSLVSATQTGLPIAFGALGTLIGLAPLFWLMAGVLALGGLTTALGAPGSVLRMRATS